MYKAEKREKREKKEKGGKKVKGDDRDRARKLVLANLT